MSASQQWTATQIRAFGERVAGLVADHLTNLPGAPVFQPYPRAEAEAMRAAPAPLDGIPPSAILDEFAAQIAPYPFGNGHPRFWGWVNSPPEAISVFAEALAAAMNPSCAGGNHAAIHLEHQLVRWFAGLMGMPPCTAGLLVSGASMATLTALAAARHSRAGFDVRKQGLQGGPRLTAYTSREGHGCVRKAVELLGIGSDQLRVIEVDEHFRMRVDLLGQQIERDRAAGLRPIAVVASAGTVNTGAIDPLEEIAALCKREDLWLHVDGAYGAPARLSERRRPPLEAIALADSVALDPHKWLYVPVEAGLVLVRDGAVLRDCFSLVPPYLRTDGNPDGVGGPPWLSEFGFQQTRGFRALKVWMALKHRGVRGYAQAIERDCALAAHLADRVRASPGLELLAPVTLSIVCFRFRGARPPDDGANDGARLDALNQSLLEELQLGGRFFLSGTTLGGRFALRACIVNPRSSEADLDALVDEILALGSRRASAG